MGSDKSFVDFVIDCFEQSAGISAKKMFGEYALYKNGKVVALICDNRLLVKITEGGRRFIGSDAKEDFPYPGAKPAFLIEERIDDKTWLSELIDITEKELPPPKEKKTKKGK